MKFLFFITLLINMVFFLWEFNSGFLNTPAEINANATKQILLLSELPKNETDDNLIVAANDIDLMHPFVSSEFDTLVTNETESTVDKSINLETAVQNLVIETKPENTVTAEKENQDQLLVNMDVPKSPTPDNDAQNTLKQDADKLKITTQLNSTDENRLLEEKPLPENDNTQKEDESIASENVINTSKPDNSNLNKTSQLNNTAINSPTEDKNLVENSTKVDVINKRLLNNEESKIIQVESKKSNCYKVGPFVNHKVLNVWSELNKINTDSMRTLKVDRQVVASHLVYYPAAETYAQSRKNARMLKKNGVTDYWLFRRGELKGIISLGLFTKEKRALSLQEKLVKKGLNVEIMPRHKTETVIFTEVSTTDESFKDRVVMSDKLGLSECEIN